MNISYKIVGMLTKRCFLRDNKIYYAYDGFVSQYGDKLHNVVIPIYLKKNRLQK